jgi:hypothetical protein
MPVIRPGCAGVTTVTVNDRFELFSCVSVAVHPTVVAPIGNVLPDAGAQTTGRVPSTRSLADAVNVTTAPDGVVAVAVMLAGTVSAGAVWSVTVTEKLPVALLLWASVAVQLTGVVPTVKLEPEAGVQLVATDPSTRSDAVEANVTGVVAPVASLVMSEGTVTDGAVRSVTVTTKPLLALLRCESVAVQLTVVVPTGKPEPEAGVQLGAIDPSTRSDAVAANVTGVDTPVASFVMSAGTVNNGAVWSVIVTTKLPFALLPCGSVAVQPTVVGPTAKADPDAGEQDGTIGPSTASMAVAV